MLGFCYGFAFYSALSIVPIFVFAHMKRKKLMYLEASTLPLNLQCRKKHSYVCPVFESTGICPQGSKCKLHHPKNCSKGRRRQPSSEQKNARGRYFGSDSKHVSVLNSKITVSNKICAEGDSDGIFFREGKSTDFVPLDVSSDEEGRGGSVSNSSCELSCSGDGHPVDKDVEDLIKPIGIMRKIVMKESSPAVGSSMEKTSS